MIYFILLKIIIYVNISAYIAFDCNINVVKDYRDFEILDTWFYDNYRMANIHNPFQKNYFFKIFHQWSIQLLSTFMDVLLKKFD